ncbi:MAG: hypothetical protein AAFQ82_21060, partial [Myxococcota bacterium]
QSTVFGAFEPTTRILDDRELVDEPDRLSSLSLVSVTLGSTLHFGRMGRSTYMGGHAGISRMRYGLETGSSDVDWGFRAGYILGHDFELSDAWSTGPLLQAELNLSRGQIDPGDTVIEGGRNGFTILLGWSILLAPEA